MDPKKFAKVLKKIQLSSKSWLFNPTSNDLWTLTVDEVNHTRPAQNSNIHDYFKFIVRTSLNTSKKNREVYVIEENNSEAKADLQFRNFISEAKIVILHLMG